MGVSDLEALRKWHRLPEQIQKKLLSNVFCPACMETSIVDYSIESDKIGILLTGKCKECGRDVARVIEKEWFE